MHKYLIASRTRRSGEMLQQAVRRTGRSSPIPVFDFSSLTGLPIEDHYECLVSWIEANAAEFGGRISVGSVTIVCDVLDLDQLDPVGNNGVHAAIAIAILCFPEVRWLAALTFSSLSGTQMAGMLGRLSLSAIDGPFHEPLFDPSGLRNTVHCNRNNRRVGIRRKVRPEALVVDDESRYAYFNAYIAYQSGCRVSIATSLAHLDSIAQDHSSGRYTVSFEDVYLNFADREASVHLSDLAQRDARFPFLRDVAYRVIQTTGQTGGRLGRIRWKKLEFYLLARRLSGQWTRVVFKPFPDIVSFWRKTGLWSRLRSDPRFLSSRAVHRLTERDVVDGHSAPGRLLFVANILLRRAQMTLAGSTDVVANLAGAMLASEALELLDTRTPTTALELISVKHQLEVAAEGGFQGVQSGIDVHARLRRLREDVGGPARWFDQRWRPVSELDAELRIASQIESYYRRFNMFHEQQACMARIRALKRGIWVRRSLGSRFLGYPIRVYFEELLSSIPVFLLAIIAWPCVLALALAWMRSTGVLAELPNAAQLFYRGNMVADVGRLDLSIVNWVGAISGITHLGVLLSHMYSVISQK